MLKHDYAYKYEKQGIFQISSSIFPCDKTIISHPSLEIFPICYFKKYERKKSERTILMLVYKIKLIILWSFSKIKSPRKRIHSHMIIDENIHDFRIDLLRAIIWEKASLFNERTLPIFSIFLKKAKEYMNTVRLLRQWCCRKLRHTYKLCYCGVNNLKY